MVSILIRMKLAVLRHSMSAQQVGNMTTGLVIGLILAGSTIWLSTLTFNQYRIARDLLAITFAIWMFGWLIGPIFAGGGDKTLRPENFLLLPPASTSGQYV